MMLTNADPPITPGSDRGKTTRKNVWIGFAPRLVEASSRSLSTLLRELTRGSTMKGMKLTDMAISPPVGVFAILTPSGQKGNIFKTQLMGPWPLRRVNQP